MRYLKKFSDKLFYQDLWRVGYFKLEGDIRDIALPNDINWLKLSNYDYEADPFLFKVGNDIFIAYEVFDYLKGNGKLAAVDLNGNSHDFFVNINSIKGHKSYPFMFEHDDEVYCLPEESDTKNLVLYKLDKNKLTFDKYATILEEDAYIDSNLYFVDSIYYISTSTASEPFKQRLFYANNIEGKYYEHPCSPIVNSDVNGRNGGFIKCSSDLFRVSQNCSNFYGENLNVNRITVSKNSYSEEIVNKIHPGSDFSRGIHNISFLEGIIVVDSKIRVFRLSNPLRKFISKVLRNFKIEFKY